MPDSRTARAGGRRRLGTAQLLVPTAVLGVTLGLAAIAMGARGALIASSSHSSSLKEQIVVDAHGDTLYALSPETARHLLCKSRECLKAWPPLTVGSRKARLKVGPGVNGKLAVIRRRRGVYQVTLRGMPLYRFAGDRAPGQTNGQGIQAFGGTWSAATASPASKEGQGTNQQGAEGPGANGNSGAGNNGAPAPSTPGYPGTVSTSSTTSTTSTTTTTTTSKYWY